MTEYHPLDRDYPRPVEETNADVTTQDIYAMLAGDFLPSEFRRLKEEERRKALVKERWKNLESYLQTFSTSHLLHIHRGGYNGNVWIPGLGNYQYTGHLYTVMKKVLATRPHQTNSREKRRAVALKQRGQGKSKNR